MKKGFLMSFLLLAFQTYAFAGNSDFGSSGVSNVRWQTVSRPTFQCENGDIVVAKRTSGYQRLTVNGRRAVGIINPTDATLTTFLLTYADLATHSPYPPFGIVCRLVSGSWALGSANTGH